MRRWMSVAAVVACVVGSVGCRKPQEVRPDDEPKQEMTETEQSEPAKMVYPETHQEPIVTTLHGVEITDPYQWLEDAAQPEVRAWMKAQDDFTQSYLKGLDGRQWLERRFTELYYIDAVSAPRRHGDRFFLYRRKAGQEKYVVYWRDGIQGEERVLIDPNTLSEDGSVALGGIYPSRDGKLVAYKLKPNNADESTLYVMNVESGETSKVDVIEGAKYASPSWLPDNSGFYYTYLPTDPNIPVMDRPGYAEVRFHKLGQDPKQDVILVERSNDPQQFVGVSVTRDGSHLFLYRQRGWTRTDVWYRPLNTKKPVTTWTPLAEGIEAQFSLTAWKGELYIHTNWDAPNWRVLKTSLKAPSLKDAKVIVPERQDGVLDGVQIIGDRLILNYMERAYNKLSVHDLNGKHQRDIELPTIGTTGGLSGEPDQPQAYFTFTSFTVPPQIYQTDVVKGDTSLWAKIDVPVDASPYQVEQVFYPSKDGTQVSMFIVSRKDMKRDGTSPLLLGGYGGFNVNMTPSFRSSIFPLLELGGVYALPNLRGGGEYGESWHKAGMLENKQNVFDDFIAAAEYLIAQGYTSSQKLAIRGGSNGGLLVGAAMTQRPDLFGAVLCSVPLLDMVRYHTSGSGKTWIPEYGSSDDPLQFKYIHAYSPYHRIRSDVRYPATLLLSADSDDRVDPMHARKMAAALQAANPEGNPILLRIEANAGHGGGDMVKKWVENDVDTYAFLFKALNMQAPVE